MEEDGWGYGGGAQAGLQNHNTSVQLLRQNETRYKRMAKILAVTLVVVLVGALPLLLTVLLGRQRHLSSDTQPTMLPASLSGIKPETLRHQDFENPSAMLTVPEGNNTDGMYLQWAHNFGIAYCRGGFNYSNGDLVVPRDGLYSVFLQITYKMECPGHVIKLMNKVLHVTEEYRKDMTLLSSSHTMSCSREVWSKSLYTAGLFFLKAKDRLHATSSHPEYITKKEYEVFFGAVLYPH